MGKKTKFDSRSDFANMVCKLLYEKHKGEVYNALLELPPIYDAFEAHVDNIYELVSDEIPLFYLYELNKHGADNWGFTDKEYAKEKKKALESCIKIYGTG